MTTIGQTAKKMIPTIAATAADLLLPSLRWFMPAMIT